MTRNFTDLATYGLRAKTPAEVRVIIAELRQRLEALYEERLRGLYLYGSYARGEAVPGSDLDVLVVLDRIESYWDEIKRVSEVRAKLSLDNDLTISLAYVAEEAWEEGDTPFVRNVRREGRAV